MLFSQTLSGCGPVLEPGSLAECILIPEKKWTKTGRMTVTQASVVRDHTQSAEILTIALDYSCKYLWILP